MEQYKTNTYEHGLISIVVHRPVPNEKERQRQEDRLRQAVACYGKEELNKQKGVRV